MTKTSKKSTPQIPKTIHSTGSPESPFTQEEIHPQDSKFRTKYQMMLAANSNDTHSSFVLPDQTCQRLALAEIQSATQNFDENLVIGHGGFGKVYKCPMTIGSVVSNVAIKRLDSTSDQGVTEFEAEVKVLSKLRHGNLVSLIGYCHEENEMVLVYEFMPNGTIRDHLRKVDCALSWLQCLKICIGAARALDYLHTGSATNQGVIHRDVKTSNILLDANFEDKVSDFGLAKVSPIDQTRTYVSTEVRGSHGYLDPCYIYSNKLTRKSDVYAFGVVLFEVLSGKQAVFSALDEDHWTLSGWAQDQMKKGKLNQLIDSRLKGQVSRQCLKEYARIAGRCLDNEPNQRPTMAEVVAKLESVLSQERESVVSIFDKGTFVYKLKTFFIAKTDLIPAGIVQRKSEMIDQHTEESGSQRLKSSTGSASLDKLLYGEKGGTSLSWVARLKIAFGAAHGLYLLRQWNQPAYSQFKTTCILVDANFNARLSNFEVRSFFDYNSSYSFKTNAYYAAPEWFRYQADIFDGIMPQHIMRKHNNGFGLMSEIYSFGVVLLEILTGMNVFDESRPEGKQKLVKWATPLLADEVNLGMIIDPQLVHNNCPPKGAFKLALVISNCLQREQEKRPSMVEILQALYECYHENEDDYWHKAA